VSTEIITKIVSAFLLSVNDELLLYSN